jgi:excisionase family DNA binding protein
VSLTVKQAAAQLGISPALVYALVQRRKIRHERHGLGRGTIRIPETALDEYRRSREFGAEDRPPAPERRRERLKHLRLR